VVGESPTPPSSGASGGDDGRAVHAGPHLLGTDTLEHSPAKCDDPFTGKPITLLPACYRRVFIHVPRADASATPRSMAP